MYRIAVEFVGPFRIYLPDRFFTVLLKGRSADVKAVPFQSESVDFGVHVHGAGVEIAHDIFGYAGRTKFCLVFDEEIDTSGDEWRTAITNRDHEIRESAIAFTNRLLEVYRDRDKNGLGEGSFHIVPLVRADLSRFRIVIVDDELNEFPGFAISWPAFRSVGMGTAVQRDATVIADIVNILRSGDPILVERELVSSALNHLWRGVYRLVPVEANTAFESFVSRMIINLDATANLSEFKGLLIKVKKLENILSTALQAVGLNAVSWFNADGWKGLAESNLLAWHKDCYSLRNRVIHEGYSGVTRAEAQNALDTMLAAQFYIENIFKK